MVLLLGALLAALVAVGVSLTMTMPPAFWDLRPATAHPTETMTAVVYKEHGDASQLEFLQYYPKPVPRSNQYLIEVKASALNPVDFKMRRNRDVPQFMIPLPKIPGADLAGVVVQSPPGATKFQVGDRVAALIPVMSKWGSHAQYAAVEERFLAKVGSTTSFEAAAAYPLVGLTVLQNFQNMKAQPTVGQKLLVHAGAGGVGTFCIQYGKHVLGMEVATTASAKKAEFVKELGADIVVDYRTQQFETILQDYDVVLDPMSWLYEERTLNNGVLKPTGYYLNIPSSDWSFEDGVEKANGFMTYKNAFVAKVKNLIQPGSVPNYGLVFVSPNGEQLQQVMDLIEANKIKPIIDRTYHLSEATEAYRYLEAGHATGKVVLYHGVKQQQQQQVDTTPTTTTAKEEGVSKTDEEAVKEEPAGQTMETAETPQADEGEAPIEEEKPIEEDEEPIEEANMEEVTADETQDAAKQDDGDGKATEL